MDNCFAAIQVMEHAEVCLIGRRRQSVVLALQQRKEGSETFAVRRPLRTYVRPVILRLSIS